MSEPRRRAILALAIPLGALIGGAVIVWSISRVLLASDLLIAPAIGILIAINVLIAAALAAGSSSRRAVAMLVVALTVPILAVGVVSAVVGERPIEAHHADEEHPPEQPPVEPEGPREQDPPEEPEDVPPPGEVGPEITVASVGFVFEPDEVALPAQTEVTVTFDNEDPAPHNISFYTARGGDEIYVGEIFTGPDSRDYTFTTPDAGTYFFQCDVHPNMTGTLTVV